MRLVSDPGAAWVSVCGAVHGVGSGSVKAGEAGQRALDSLWPSRTPSSGKTQAYQGADTWYRGRVVFAGFRSCRRRMKDWNFVYELHNWPEWVGGRECWFVRS